MIKDEYIFNGPHMDMTETEREVIMASLIPGVISLRKLFGLSPFHLRNKSEYILKSARETMVIEEGRGTTLFVVRIADYYVGKILTWVKKGACVTRGEKNGDDRLGLTDRSLHRVFARTHNQSRCREVCLWR